MRATAALLAIACACSHAQAPRRPGEFVEMESEHFTLAADLPDEYARATLRDLENVRAALAQAAWHARTDDAGKLQVVQFASSAELHQFASRTIDAFYQPVDLFGEPMLVLTTEQGPAQSTVLKHEMAHAIYGTFLFRAPRWLSEGLACYLETLRYDAVAQRWIAGEPSEARLSYLRAHGDLDFAHFLALPAREAVLLRDDAYAYQTVGWLAVFYLANERRDRLDDLIDRLARGDDPDKSMAAAGIDIQALAAALHSYRPEAHRTMEVQPPQWRGDVQVRTLVPADVQALRAELFFLSPGLPRTEARLPAAAQAANAALQEDPTHPLALAVQAALAGGPDALLVKSIRAAAEKRSEDFRAQLLLALVLPDNEPVERRAALVKAAALAPHNAPVLNALAWHDVTHGRAKDAVPLAERAARLAPANAAVLDTLATALAVSARCREATKTEERALELAGERASAEFRKQLVARLDAMRAGCAAVPLE
jgi:Flp pilus assembly protein TadD